MKQAKYKVVANGPDITAAIRSRLLSLEITDNSGVDSDTVVIELDNREGKVKLPATGAELKVWIGFDDNLIFKGLYEVDELEIPLDDDVFTIHAKAIKMKGSLKAPQDLTYDNITFGSLVDQIANRHGYEAKVAGELSAVTFPHIDQKSESDLNLLSRLARESGGFFKPVANKLVIATKGSGRSVSGKTLPKVTISDSANTSGRVTIQKRSDYKSVIANWFDEVNQIEVQAVAGSGEPQYKVRRIHPDQEQAQRAAEAKLKGFQRGQATMSFVRPLMPGLSPESKVTFENHHQVANKEWLIESVNHKITNSGVSETSASAIIPT